VIEKPSWPVKGWGGFLHLEEVQRQDRQVVVDGSSENSVSGDGEEGDFAEGEVII